MGTQQEIVPINWLVLGSTWQATEQKARDPKWWETESETRCIALPVSIAQPNHRQSQPSRIISLSLAKDQLEQLYKLLTHTSPSSSLLAERGNFMSPLTCRGNVKQWVIDSGATDYMTGCEKLFNSYSPCPGHFKVKIADRSLSSVAGIGTIRLTHMSN